MRKEIANKSRYAKVVGKIITNLQPFRIQCKKLADPIDVEEVSRQLSLFNSPFIADCADIVGSMLYCLRLSVPPAAFAVKTMRVMEIRSIIVPEIGAPKCVFLREKVAKIIADTVNNIRDVRFDGIKKKWIEHKKQKAVAFKIKNDKSKKINAENQSETESRRSSISRPQSEIQSRRQSFVLNRESFEKSIREAGASEDHEFIGDLSGITGNLNKVIDNELERFFQILCKSQFEISSTFDHRDFVHIYPFQKHFLQESIKFFMEYVKIKQQYFWTRIGNFNAWILLSKTYSSKIIACDCLEFSSNNTFHWFCF